MANNKYIPLGQQETGSIKDLDLATLQDMLRKYMKERDLLMFEKTYLQPMSGYKGPKNQSKLGTGLLDTLFKYWNEGNTLKEVKRPKEIK